ncbi:hypothetical protein Tco_0591437 [Tanacetum coccineum]
MFIVMVLDSWVCCFCNIDGFGLWMNMGVIEMVGPERFRVMPLMDASFPYREVHIKIEIEMSCPSRVKFITACSYLTNIFKEIMKAQAYVSKLPQL